MIHRLIRLVFFLMFAAFDHASALAGELPFARDLHQEAAEAGQRGAVLVVLFSRTDCPYCRTVRHNYLAPLVAGKDARVAIVELVVDRPTPLRNFAGLSTTATEFATSQGVKLAPVVAFYGPHGEKAAKPLVGALLPDFYPAYLEAAIVESLQRMTR